MKREFHYGDIIKKGNCKNFYKLSFYFIFIYVKPDGSRVLVVTMNFGGIETTMSLEISKPTAIQNANPIVFDETNTHI